ncbi:MAG TPA: TauD/TfdA family dioxygenase [Pyrinomonadaceae bacterium]|jgi:alpha-ketoglutarate-dependent taurine dioxygenase
MSEENRPVWTLEPLEPFGVLLHAPRAGAHVREVPARLFEEWFGRGGVVVARGFAPLEADALPEFGRRFGEVLEWDFGEVNELRARAGAQNYLYTNREVPFHWDGAFVGRVPRYIIFQCESAPPTGAGGETLFCDTRRLLGRAGPGVRESWGRVRITDSTEKVVHYGGTFTSPLLATHPFSGEPVLRYAEPVEDLNPVRLEMEGVTAEARAAFLLDMRRRLRDPEVCYAHRWRDGDILVADNHALLHGRRAFAESAPRHLRRVNVL